MIKACLPGFKSLLTTYSIPSILHPWLQLWLLANTFAYVFDFAYLNVVNPRYGLSSLFHQNIKRSDRVWIYVNVPLPHLSHLCWLGLISNILIVFY